MSNVITQTEMIQYMGKDRAVFPAGTILTPLAKDFAAENNISIVTGTGPEECVTEKEKLLKAVIQAVKENAALSGRIFSRDDMVRTVAECLERVGCSVI